MKCLFYLCRILFEIYGIKNSDELKGKYIKTAYSCFPDICKCYHLLLDVFPTPEAAAKNGKRY